MFTKTEPHELIFSKKQLRYRQESCFTGLQEMLRLKSLYPTFVRAIQGHYTAVTFHTV